VTLLDFRKAAQRQQPLRAHYILRVDRNKGQQRAAHLAPVNFGHGGLDDTVALKAFDAVMNRRSRQMQDCAQLGVALRAVNGLDSAETSRARGAVRTPPMRRGLALQF
jgi:hypothetical protein